MNLFHVWEMDQVLNLQSKIHYRDVSLIGKYSWSGNWAMPLEVLLK